MGKFETQKEAEGVARLRSSLQRDVSMFVSHINGLWCAMSGVEAGNDAGFLSEAERKVLGEQIGTNVYICYYAGERRATLSQPWLDSM